MRGIGEGQERDDGVRRRRRWWEEHLDVVHGVVVVEIVVVVADVHRLHAAGARDRAIRVLRVGHVVRRRRGDGRVLEMLRPREGRVEECGVAGGGWRRARGDKEIAGRVGRGRRGGRGRAHVGEEAREPCEGLVVVGAGERARGRAHVRVRVRRRRHVPALEVLERWNRCGRSDIGSRDQKMRIADLGRRRARGRTGASSSCGCWVTHAATTDSGCAAGRGGRVASGLVAWGGAGGEFREWGANGVFAGGSSTVSGRKRRVDACGECRRGKLVG